MRGGNRNMRRMMDRMGLDMNDIKDVREVVIKTNEKEIIITKPQVSEMKGKDGSVFTVTGGDYEEKELEVPIFSDDDIDLICEQTGVERERAIEALGEAKGDLAQAIMLLTDN
ncbi:transcription factor [Cenarchaeum symbiosum A]|uniref:Nascent polypeptide-associated complex protein n=1 Tax=Cenarchaeum symbiosum (strain A) TaxID=414004 RepID=A0RYD6_CENSY|nr:transcription factor [Cenarchaeum symbiosum A]